MKEERTIRSIAVAGAGIVGLSAALAFARALPGTRLTVIETAVDPAALADQLPTAHPTIARFHALIGLNEIELVRSGIATHHLGTIFDGWSASGEPWVHAFSNYGKPADGVPFDQVWVQAQRLGKALPYDRYATGAALARAGKFVHPARDPNVVASRFLYGLRVDPELYRERLRNMAEGSGVAIRVSEIGNIDVRTDGSIERLQLADGQSVEADLFVDCTGPEARLLSSLDDSFEDWSAWMPFDRIRIASRPSDAVPSSADAVTAGDAGWSVELPLCGRALTAHVGTREGVPMRRGRRVRPWVRNVLALGDAATCLDPLHGFQLELAQQAILLALELLPGRDFPDVETGEYNRRAELITRRVRDFIALHYLLGPWKDVIGSEPPDSLARTLDQFGYRSRIPFHEDEIITRDSWTAALLGLGLIPRNVDPQAAVVPLDQVIPAMERLAAEIDRFAASAPNYRDYLARMTL